MQTAGAGRPVSGLQSDPWNDLSPGTTSRKAVSSHSVEEAREQLGGISRNTIYDLLRNGELASVQIGRSRFISAAGSLHGSP